MLHLAWLAPSLTSDDGPTATGTRRSPDLIVMTANLLYGQADANALVREVRDRRVDVLVVEELTPSAVERLREAGLEQLLPSSVLAPASEAAGTGSVEPDARDRSAGRSRNHVRHATGAGGDPRWPVRDGDRRAPVLAGG